MGTHRRPKRVKLTIATMLAVASCERAPDNAVQNEPMAETLPRPPLPVAEPPLDRAGLLLAVAKAASAAALGEEDQSVQRDLEGDRFELRIRFGCPGAPPAGEAGSFSARFDPQSHTLRLRAAPDLTTGDPWIATLAGETVEAVEGFWLRRPWLLSAGCPPTVRAPASRPGPSGTETNLAAIAADAAADAEFDHPQQVIATQRIGIAEFFTTEDTRAGRRDKRAYEVTKALGDNVRPSTEGYDLVLSGRLRRLQGQRVVSCRMTSVDLPPGCIIAAEFDRVRIERADSGESLADWAR